MPARFWRGALALLLLLPATGAFARTCALFATTSLLPAR